MRRGIHELSLKRSLLKSTIGFHASDGCASYLDLDLQMVDFHLLTISSFTKSAMMLSYLLQPLRAALSSAFVFVVLLFPNCRHATEESRSFVETQQPVGSLPARHEECLIRLTLRSAPRLASNTSSLAPATVSSTRFPIVRRRFDFLDSTLQRIWSEYKADVRSAQRSCLEQQQTPSETLQRATEAISSRILITFFNYIALKLLSCSDSARSLSPLTSRSSRLFFDLGFQFSYSGA
jgi:hypothetical protein